MLVALGADLAYSVLQTPVYATSSELLLRASTPESLATTPGDASTRPATTEVLIIESAPAMAAVEKRLGYRPAVSARQLGNSDVVRLRAESTDPGRAVKMANVYAATYAELRNRQLGDDLAQAKRELQAKLGDLDRRIEGLPPGPERDTATSDRGRLQSRVDQVDVDSALASSYVKILSEATPPGSPARPRTLRDALLAGALGLLVGILVAALLENLDDSIKSRAQLEKALNDVPVVGIVPAKPGARSGREQLAALREPDSPTAEAYRKLRTSLQFVDSAGPMQTLQVTSPGPMQGKTTTVANLGVAIAQAGLHAVVVCTDLRRPRLHELFGLDNSVGFTSVLVGAVPLSAAVQPVAEQARLSVLPSGPLPPNPSELLASRRTVEVLTSLQAEYDVVLLDTPPVLPVADAVVLSCRVDATLIACVADVTTTREAGRAAEALRLVGAPIVGAVLHGTATETLAADLERYGREERSLDRQGSKRGRAAK